MSFFFVKLSITFAYISFRKEGVLPISHNYDSWENQL